MITFIIPVYNVSAYLRECLDSLLMQTCSEWEAVCVDDGSVDNSYDILQEYAKRDARFKVIRSSNAGTFNARRRGVEKSNGEWISFLDPDDWIRPEFCEVLLNKLKRVKCDILQCGVEILETTDRTKAQRQISECYFNPNVKRLNGRLSDLVYCNRRIGWNLIYRVFKAEMIVPLFAKMPDVYADLADDVSKYNKQLNGYKVFKDSIPDDVEVDNFGKASFKLNEAYYIDNDFVNDIQNKITERLKEHGLDNVITEANYGYDGKLQFSIIGLENTQEYYEKINHIYDEIKSDVIKKIQETNSSIKSEMDSFNKYIYTWLSSDLDYTGIDNEGLKTAIQELLFNSNWMNDIPKNIDSTKWNEELEEWLKTNYLDAINNIKANENTVFISTYSISICIFPLFSCHRTTRKFVYILHIKLLSQSIPHLKTFDFPMFFSTL